MNLFLAVRCLVKISTICPDDVDVANGKFFCTMVSLPVTVISKRTEVCYDHVGCFSIEPPWVGPTRPLPAPQSPEKVKLEFYLMSRNTADRAIDEWKVITTDFYKPTMDNLNDLDYQSSRIRTAVLVHGMYHTNKWNWSLLRRIAMAYLLKEDVNIIFVKYDAKIWNIYFRLVANIRTVGAIAAKFLVQLMQLTALKTDQIHLIGFSLGAHVTGYIGKRISNIHRITGLEPAKPFFENAVPMYRLSNTDAEHVDVLHTNTAIFIPFGGLGYKGALGDVDFYFNGGSFQPGCVVDVKNLLKTYLKFRLKKAFVRTYLILGCSHLRSIEYWAESLENFQCIMWGVPQKRRVGEIDSSSTSTMQMNSEYGKRGFAPVGLDTFSYVLSGKFYVRTRMTSPYCLPEYDLSRAIEEDFII